MIRLSARLSSSQPRDRLHLDVLQAMDRALDAANPRVLVRKHVHFIHDNLVLDGLSYPLERYRRIFVIGAGKASGLMGEGIERTLGARITGGLVIVPRYLRASPKEHRIQYFPGSHPIPSQKNLDGVVRMLKLVAHTDKNDLVIVLLSGGSSALLELPLSGITLDDVRRITFLLLKSGANIHEVNTVRKHISRLKGGRLAQMIKARLLTLIVSDVVGDQVDSIGSGPTTLDPTTYQDARHVLDKYNLWLVIPPRIRRVIDEGIRGSVQDTPKEQNDFRHVDNVVIGRNKESCNAFIEYMQRKGYRSQILSTRIQGEARIVGHLLGSILSDIRDNGVPISSPGALVSGGETTVTVTGKGTGGRNQEVTLAGAIAIRGIDGVVIGSFATDGIDGPTDAAGAIADGSTVNRGRRLGMDPEKYLIKNDSYRFFSRLGDLIKTGPTGTSVNDIMVIAANQG